MNKPDADAKTPTRNAPKSRIIRRRIHPGRAETNAHRIEDAAALGLSISKYDLGLQCSLLGAPGGTNDAGLRGPQCLCLPAADYGGLWCIHGGLENL